MAAIMLRLMTLLALVLMPIGMSAAQAAPAHHAPAAATAQHCGEHGSKPAKSEQPFSAADCTMGCSMLLLGEIRLRETPPAASLAPARRLVLRLTGIHPNPVTPPPKLS